jgi:hypothetical protein
MVTVFGDDAVLLFYGRLIRSVGILVALLQYTVGTFCVPLLPGAVLIVGGTVFVEAGVADVVHSFWCGADDPVTHC